MDRLFSVVLRGLALAFASAAVLLALLGFIDYLQTGRWPTLTLLELGYDSGLLKARWFLVKHWSLPVRDVLDELPVTLVALGLAPLCWWLGSWLGRR